MGLMGLGKSIVDGVVALRYEANVDQAKAAIKDLSGEQKKAAKETAEAYKQQNEAFKKHVADFGKGAAIIGAALLVAKTSWTAYRDEAKLSAGAAGVSIDKLSESYSGLKSRMELLTLAQAGHQGAWKLTTGQLQHVIEGMRALEKKGHDSQQVFEKFTEVIKKGKLEGLDDFGLSLKSTGDQSKDLQVLMRALGKEVADVGGNFDKAGDDVQRGLVKMEDGITRVRVSVGKLTNDILDAAAEFGRAWGQVIYGDLPEDVGPGARGGDYANRFAAARGLRVGGGQVGTGSGTRAVYRLFAGATDADRAAGQTLAAFRGQVRRANAGAGPLASASPDEWAKAMTGLPQDWEKVDAGLAAMVDRVRESSKSKWMLSMYKWGMSARMAAEAGAGGRGGRGGRGGSDIGPGLFFGARDRIVGAVDSLAALEGERAAGAMDAQARIDALGNAGMSTDLADAKEAALRIQASFDEVAKAEADKRESFLERTFGKLEEFEAYAQAFDTLAKVGGSAWSAFYDAIVTGEESLGAAVRKAIAASLGAKAKEFGAEGFMTFLRGAAYTATLDPRGPGTMAAGAAMMAGALTVGAIAQQLGGGSSTGAPSAASSAAGVAGRPSGERVAQSGVVIVGDPLADDSARERARRVRRAMRSAGQDAEGVSHG